MIPTAARLSKASRAPLTPKRGNKDFYKGTRQAFLPGSRRTGAPGQHVIRGKAKYRLLDEKVRVYVAPPIEEINSSPLKPYVAMSAKLSPDQESAVFSKFRNVGGLTPEHFLRVSREYAYALQNPEAPARDAALQPAWMGARIRLNLMPNPYTTGVAVAGSKPVAGVGAAAARGGRGGGATLFERPRVRELEVVQPDTKQ